jgi:hypothetical protein
MLMKKEKNQYVLICFKGSKMYEINLLLKRSLWSRFTHHQIGNRLVTKGDLLLV